jgi:hypothetical protein
MGQMHNGRHLPFFFAQLQAPCSWLSERWCYPAPLRNSLCASGWFGDRFFLQVGCRNRFGGRGLHGQEKRAGLAASSQIDGTATYKQEPD